MVAYYQGEKGYTSWLSRVNQLIMGKAQQADAIVSSNFPSAVRTKLYEGNEVKKSLPPTKKMNVHRPRLLVIFQSPPPPNGSIDLRKCWGA
jgi:hypothetical protein